MASESQPAARKPSGGKAKKPKRLSQKEQSERFIETARTLGVTDEEFAQALDALLPAKPGEGQK